MMPYLYLEIFGDRGINCPIDHVFIRMKYRTLSWSVVCGSGLSRYSFWEDNATIMKMH